MIMIGGYFEYLVCVVPTSQMSSMDHVLSVSHLEVYCIKPFKKDLLGQGFFFYFSIRENTHIIIWNVSHVHWNIFFFFFIW